MECRKLENLKECGCTYPGCSRKGICCECIRHHREHKEVPGCLFPGSVEKRYDRSFRAFIAAWQGKV